MDFLMCNNAPSLDCFCGWCNNYLCSIPLMVYLIFLLVLNVLLFVLWQVAAGRAMGWYRSHEELKANYTILVDLYKRQADDFSKFLDKCCSSTNCTSKLTDSKSVSKV